ncbi:MAG TPA: nucleotidyltransferase family protein [Pyrinomonadaceae bacterium]|jgi:molybdenum cofactor cytidylyltransferase
MDETNDSGNDRIGIVVLAAGGSTRMKQPKQLIRFGGKTLLRRAAQTAVASVYQPVVVVLGANFEKTKTEIEDLPVEIVYNRDWEGGLGASLKTGVEKLLEIAPAAAAVVIALADQPFVTAEHLNLLAANFERLKTPIVAAAYDETRGVPALFSREVFDDLCRLSEDKGAKVVIEKHRAALSTIELPEAAFDLDTPQDWQAAQKRL